MADQILEDILCGTGLCLECTSFAPSYIILRICFFIISTILSVIDTYTDWVVVKRFENKGFNYPLLPIDNNWLRAWYLFASIGTFFACFSIFHDGLDIFHSIIQSCKTYTWKSCFKTRKGKRKQNIGLTGKVQFVELSNVEPVTAMNEAKNETINEHGLDITGDEGKNETAHESKDETTINEHGLDTTGDEESDEIPDACTCCYRYGWNVETRNEILSIIILWFQSVPMLTLSVLFALTQYSCQYPSSEDVTSVLLDVCKSATSDILTSTFRVLRSTYRLTISICLRAKEKNYFGVKKILTKNEDTTIYPPGKCSQLCVIPFHIALIFQYFIITNGFGITILLWVLYIFASIGSLPHADLGLYHLDLETNQLQSSKFLFDLSDTLLPPNNTSYIFNDSILYPAYNEVFCQSKFEYRKTSSHIYYNTMEYSIIDENGKFCANFSFHSNSNNTCRLFYLSKFITFYGFLSNGRIKRFDEECLILKDRINFFAGPDIDFNIQFDVDTNTTRLPHGNNTELGVYYPSPINLYIPISKIFNSTKIKIKLNSTKNYIIEGGYLKYLIYDNITCIVYLRYDKSFSQVVYDFCNLDKFRKSNFCCCGRVPNATKCGHFHENIVYASRDMDSMEITPYTSCAFIPKNKLVPIFQDSLLPDCTCG